MQKAPIDQERYYAMSRSADLPARCPILNYCTRRAFTIYFFSDYSKNDWRNDVADCLVGDGVLPDDFKKESIPLQGETVIWKKSDVHIYYHNTCPEVNLFDSENSLPFARGRASTDGEWDDLRISEKFKDGKNKHFSECAEFSKHIFDVKAAKTIPLRSNRQRKKRAPISTGMRFEIFQRDEFKCHYCGKSKDEGAVLELDHKVPVSRGGKDSFENLVTSCKECNRGKSNKTI